MTDPYRMPKTPWITCHDGSRKAFGFTCERCGVSEPRPVLPIPISRFLRLSRDFTEEHKRCLLAGPGAQRHQPAIADNTPAPIKDSENEMGLAQSPRESAGDEEALS